MLLSPSTSQTLPGHFRDSSGTLPCRGQVLLSLSTEAHEDGSYFSELARWENLGPIVDFAVLDPELSRKCLGSV